ncbi:hypothetical protein H920_04548 [Fukomys damarensis]|uniref:Uncharacterized protein n=1 Tax=Fukomys damarensis TaxID=885580 RepID=A0A091DPI8_FUKDA|nr:hypothetical protein H920_04548 [Fukomys damarensis]
MELDTLKGISTLQRDVVAKEEEEEEKEEEEEEEKRMPHCMDVATNVATVTGFVVCTSENLFSEFQLCINTPFLDN